MSLNSKEQLHKLLHLLSTAAANAALYNLQHLQVLRLNKQAMAQVQTLFADRKSTRLNSSHYS